MMKIKPGMFLRYKYTPDDGAVVQVKQILESTPDRVVFLGKWVSYDQDQQVVITKENQGSWEVTK